MEREALACAPTASSTRSRWRIAAGVVAESRDVLDGRPDGTDDDGPPELEARGWASFLLSLDDAELATIERAGHDESPVRWPKRTPHDLLSLLARANDVCAVPAITAPCEPRRPARRGETPRKSMQVDAFGRLLAPLT